MRFVLDASVTLSWAMRDEDNPLADIAFEYIQTDSSLVPAIWWYEIRNALLISERRGRIEGGDIAKFLSAVSRFDIEVRAPEAGQRTMDLAREYRLSIYDAAYLALASEEKIPLATLDERLQSAARSAGVSLLS